MELLIIIFCTAILSSLLTLAGIYISYVFWIKDRLKQHLQQLEVQMGKTLERRVTAGVLNAIGVATSTENLKDTTQAVAKTGLELISDLFSRRHKDDPEK